MRTPIAHPLPVLGSILCHKADGSTALLPASTECFYTFDVNAVRELYGLQLLNEDCKPATATLAAKQDSIARTSVLIRSTPGFRDCGYESVEVESKDERIVRLEQQSAALSKLMRLAKPIVDQDYEVANVDAELLDEMDALRVQIQQSSRGGVVSPNGCEVVR